MYEVHDAQMFVNSYARDFGSETIPLIKSVNRSLTNRVLADWDFPPFDRVTMDGIAISSKAFAGGKKEFRIEKISAAGSVLQSLQQTDACVEVMTGSVLPGNTDVVIPYEQCTIQDGIAKVSVQDVEPFQNVHRKGRDEKEGALLLEKHIRITPAHVSLMATVGITKAEVYKLPSVAVCATGDELVPVSLTPQPHQLRQSNIYYIAADLERQGITPALYHLPDDRSHMKEQLKTILDTYDAIILSGAVSMGKYDYLPQVLEELDVQVIFHGVNQRPGKPFLFGVRAKQTVFGFPGNPVSSFVCYYVYFREWLDKCSKFSEQKMTAKLASDVTVTPSLSNHILVKLFFADGCVYAERIGLSGSGDQIAMIGADGIITLPVGRKVYQKGEVFPVISCR